MWIIISFQLREKFYRGVKKKKIDLPLNFSMSITANNKQARLEIAKYFNYLLWDLDRVVFMFQS